MQLMKNIYVIAWEYNGGGGFDWYTNRRVRDKQFKEERANDAVNGNGWQTKRFDISLPKGTDVDDYLEENHTGLFDTATYETR